ncbi:probable multidrug resistance transporter, MFS superfamily (plasmid) [Rhodococcus jostii RHA1]|uniref:Probable multidrug resistance transporter, MFS superfamily n=1 Tax=Rhodococcus jostii (strain RHA1) TaxID=101510 RepID=Q0RW02_RHOJR|nr:MFS transporter [Rhodococcus jostii]ABH00534.1 probable multidrug resistance transporter, MFS superfamily [Rhodococcus jostii RHA1]
MIQSEAAERSPLARGVRPSPPSQVAPLAALALAGLCTSFMHTLVIPIQNDLPALLHAPRSDTAWVLTITLLVSAVSTPIAGRLGDLYGKRRVMSILLLLLVAGSVVAAMTSSVWVLVFGRGLQGAGVGVIPLSISLLRDILPVKQLGSAVGLISATLGVGGAVALPLSALVVQYAEWHLLFWMAAALGLCCIAALWRFVPRDEVQRSGRLDIVGAFVLSTVITTVLLLISHGDQWGWTSPFTIICAAIAAISALMGGWYELRRTDPVVDLRVSAKRPVLFTNLASLGLGFTMFAASVMFPQFLQQPLEVGGGGLSLMSSSLVVMPSGLAMLAMSLAAGRLERILRPQTLLIAAALTMTVGYSTLWLLGSVQVWQILVVNLLVGLGIGIGFAAMPLLIMNSVPVKQSGAANGLNTLMRSLGTASASAVIAALLATSASRGEIDKDLFQRGFMIAAVAGCASAICAAWISSSRPHKRLS